MSNDWTSPPEVGQSQYGFPPPPGAPVAGPGASPHLPPIPPGGWNTLTVRPGVIPLRALSLGDVFEGAVRTIRGNPDATLGMAFLVTLVFMIPSTLLMLVANQVDVGENEVVREGLFLVGQYGSTVLQVIGSTALAGALTVVLADAVLGRRMSIAAAWQKVKGRLWALIGANFLIALMTYGGLALIVLLMVLAIAAIGPAGGFVGVLLILGGVPAVIFVWIKLCFASAVVVLERRGPIMALKRSWALTRGQWWRIFGITLLAYVLIAILLFCIFIPVLIVIAVLADPAQATGGEGDALPSVATVLGTQAALLVLSTITGPFLAGVTGLLYLDQRVRKEALDITLISAAQPATTAAPR